jgi:phosphohistidine phosphatase
MERTLYLLRHAKSSWEEATLPDRERPLSSRGRRACRLVAEHLRRVQVTPELVLCSSATRTRETLALIAPGFGRPVEALFEDRLYDASAAELLVRLQTVDESVASLMLIGHNPAIQELARSLVCMRAKALEGKFPTGALATLVVTTSWSPLAAGSATLRAFVKPRELQRHRNR